jgi:DnaK suppressor protein
MVLEDNLRALLGAVDLTIQRIDAGTWGLCQRCGEPIPPERLEAMPTAELCITCKEREEGGSH